MMDHSEMIGLIDDALEQQALAIGGMAAEYGMEDRIVRGLIESLVSIRNRTLRRLKEEPIPHPAIEEFLLSLRKPDA